LSTVYVDLVSTTNCWNSSVIGSNLYKTFSVSSFGSLLLAYMKQRLDVTARYELSLLTEMSTRNLPEGKRRLARKANNLTAICEPIV
jgi:hypothetical protein